MSEAQANDKKEVWPKNRTTYYVETGVIILLTIFAMILQYGRFDTSILLSAELGIRIVGSLCIWFANRFTLDYILQSRIEADKVTQFVPFELTLASIAVTSFIYIIFYPIFIYLYDLNFVFVNFLQGLFLTGGLSLLIVIFYAGIQIWESWWSDGEFLFSLKNSVQPEIDTKDFISIKNSQGTFNHKLRDVLYFISESKIAFMVDASGKKWITQYTLSELESMLDRSFFRLNRRILASRQAISQIKKLPNHRLLVTVSQPDGDHKETISRYKSTRFKQWFHKNTPEE